MEEKEEEMNGEMILEADKRSYGNKPGNIIEGVKERLD